MPAYKSTGTTRKPAAPKRAAPKAKPMSAKSRAKANVRAGNAYAASQSRKTPARKAPIRSAAGAAASRARAVKPRPGPNLNPFDALNSGLGQLGRVPGYLGDAIRNVVPQDRLIQNSGQALQKLDNPDALRSYLKKLGY